MLRFALLLLVGSAAGADLFLIGTRTRGEQGSQGIHAAAFDARDGSLGEPRLVAEAPSPGFLAWHPQHPLLYAIGPERLLAFRAGPDGELAPLDRTAIGDGGACHLAPHPAGRGLAVANYGGGSISLFRLAADGRFDGSAVVHRYRGHGPHPTRQRSPHAHGVHFSGDLMLVPDLGTDRIMAHRFDPAAGEILEAADPPFATARPGDGPRHAAFHPQAPYVFVNHELGNALEVYRREGERLHSLARIGTLPDGWIGENTTAEVAVHPNGRWVLVSNRGHDSIAVFRFDPDTGRLKRQAIVPCGVRTPRHFTLSPDGRWLLVAGQDSDDIRSLSFDPDTGELAASGHRITCPHPICLLFVPERIRSDGR